MEFWKLNLKEIGVLKINWELESWKLVLRIGVLKINFERSFNFENYLRIGVFEIKFERNWNFENYLRIGVLKIKFKNWSFGNQIWKKLEFWKLIENSNLENLI